MPIDPEEPRQTNTGSGSEPFITVDFSKPIVPLTWLAMCAGSALILLSVLGTRPLIIPPHISNLLVGCGASILLAAFGGQAVVRGKGYVFAGVAGVAIGIVAFLSWQDHEFRRDSDRKLELLKDSFLVGRISGLPVDKYRVRLSLAEDVPNRHVSDQRRFDFVMFRKDLDESGPASLEIENKSDEALHTFEIRHDCIVGFLGQSKPLLWRYRSNGDNSVLVEEGTNTIVSKIFSSELKIGECRKVPAAAESPETGLLEPFLGKAFADDDLPLAEAITREEIDKALVGIQSADTDIRRAARLTLSRAKPEDVAHILTKVREKLAINRNIYRTKLGVSVALAEMLRRDKTLRERIILERSEIELLLEFAGSDDRTLRIYSAEFLYDLESPAVTEIALPMAVNAPDDDARYNWILVSQGGWLRLPEETKKQLSPVIAELRRAAEDLPKTAKLLEFF